MNRGDEKTGARRRFWLLQLARWSGVAMVLLAIAIYQGAIPAPAIVPRILALTGLGVFFLLPNLMRRGWRKERP